MKTIAGKLMLLAFILQLGWSNSTIADEDYTRKINKEYSTNANTVFDISNKYGDINIKNWDKKTISIEVTIKVEARNQEKADELFDRIKINLNQSGNNVNAITEITHSFNNTSFSIDYDVNMPKDIRLKLINKYGDVFINEMSGHSEIGVKYGNLKINTLSTGNSKPRSVVTLGYSKGSIKNCDWLKLSVGYSKLEVENAQALMLESKYSKITVDKCNSIVCESKYDTPIKIGLVKNFISSAKYSSFRIEKLLGKLELEVKYTDCKIYDTSADFKLIDIDQNYGNVDLSISPDASYYIDAYTEYGDIDLPSHANNVSKMRDKSELKIKGTVGSDSDPQAKVRIVSRYGNVDLE